MGDLKESRSQLQEYTDNLEHKVAERTEALERSQDLLQEQVRKRNRELRLYNTLTELITATDSLETILHKAIVEVLQVVPAKRRHLSARHPVGMLSAEMRRASDRASAKNSH
ncbi:hypothetical protein [Desulfosarcina cetonica]|uniref:hypothetical protein n=1 Tax=Desulfosarcina cetonica TaxID=90730 RepID=UPI0006D1E586|nr:hypothetical protein [Desulfosarcina cetonica]